MMLKENCTHLLKPCVLVRIDPCDCRYYYQCSPQDILRRRCAKGAVFNPQTQNCFFASLQICDIHKPWTRCRLADFGISNDQIQSVSDCRTFWPEEMKDWDLTFGRRTRTETTLATPSEKTRETLSQTTNPTVIQTTRVDDNVWSPSVTLSNNFEFDTPASNTYIPVIVCGMVALVVFIAIIIFWQKRSDIKNLIGDFCCFGKKEKAKSICNPGYENTIATFDSRLDMTTGEHVYNEIPHLNPESVVNRPLPQTPQQPRASTFAGFGCPDVAIRKEQAQVQRTNSACQTYDKLTSREDRGLIDAQERFANEHRVSREKTRHEKKKMAARLSESDRKTQVFEQQQKETDKRRSGRHRNHNVTRLGIARHRTSPGRLDGIKEDLELTIIPNPCDSTETLDSENIAESPLEMNNCDEYSGVWHGVSINRKPEMN